MFRLCPLILLPLLLFLLSFQASWGEQTLTLQSSVESQSRPGEIGEVERKMVRSTRSSILYSSGRLYNFQYRGSFEISSPDYSDYEIQNSIGQRESLSTHYSRSVEYLLNQELEYARGEHTVTIGYFTHLNFSPFRIRGGRVSYSKSFYNRTSVILARAIYYQRKKPVDFFSKMEGNSIITAKRPSVVYGHKIELGAQQVLSAVNKFQLLLSTSQLKKDRPRNFGAKLSYKHALSDAIYTTMNLERVFEPPGTQLYNERGRFRYSAADVEVNYEPYFDLLLSLSYGLAVEVESELSDGREIQVGTDTYGFGAEYSFPDYRLYLQGSFSQNNIDDEGLSLNGGLAWSF